MQSTRSIDNSKFICTFLSYNPYNYYDLQVFIYTYIIVIGKVASILEVTHSL